MVDHATRLVAYAPLGDRLGVLPDPLSFSATTPHATEDRGALSLTYSKLARRGDILGRRLTDGLEVALEEHDGTTWAEVTNGRFVVAKGTSDRTDRTETESLSAPHFSWLLTKIKHAAPDESLYAPEGQNEGRRQFIGVNAGIVIASLLGEYADRGGPTIARGFTTSTDSNGAVWPPLNAFWVSRGEALDVTISRLAAGGAVDVWWDGRTMHAAPMQPGRDRSTQVILREGLHVAAAPSEETIEDLIQAHTVHGGEGVLVTDVDPSAPSPWGRWEGFASDDRYTTSAGAHLRNQTELADAARLRGQYTRDLTPECPHRLGSDIRAGDWITAPTHAARERVRVASLLWRMDSQGMTRSLILNDSILNAELARLRKQRLGDAGSSGEGSTVKVTPEGQDKRTPAQVPGLSLATQAYINPDGAARGLIVAQWAAVSTATVADGGGALEVERYEIATRVNTAGAPWSIILSTQELSAEWGDLDPGTEVAVRVRARGRYATTPGIWSATQVVTVADDVTPPPVPSDLTPSSSNGVASFEWDGLTHLGQPQPLDFSHMAVEWEAIRGGSNIAGEDSMRGAGRTHVPGLDRGSVARARGKSVDRSGNESGFSPWVSVTIASVLDDTGLDEALDGLDDRVADITDNVIPGLAGDVEIAGGRFTASADAPTEADGVGKPEQALWSRYDGSRLVGTWLWTGTGWVEREPQRVHIDQGTFGDLDGVRITAGTVVASDALAVGSIDNPILLADGVITAPKVYTDRAFMNKLAAGFAEFDTVEAGWIKGAYISADALNFKSATGLTITSGTFHTSPTTNRGVTINTSGIQAWNSSGARRLFVSAATGSVTLGNNAIVIDGSTGNVDITGDFQTRAGSYPNVEIRRGTWADFTGLRFNLDSSSASSGETPELKMNHSTFAGYLAGSLFLSAKGVGGVVNRPEIRLGRNTTYGQAIELQIAEGGSVASYTLQSPGAHRFGNQSGAFIFSGMTQGSQSLNVGISSGWQLYYSGSVRALKTDIAELRPDDPYAVLELQPVAYRDRGEVSRHGDAAEYEVGFIAEQVAEVAAEHTHLTPLLQHMDGKLTGFAYDRLPAALMPLLADMHDRLTDIEHHLSRLETP